MRQVILAIQVQTDEEADLAFAYLESIMPQVENESVEDASIFVADDLGTVSRA